MRIERIRDARIGRLVGFDSGQDPLPGLVVVLGPNESGKSSLFQLLCSGLYGFSPATRERNPLTPWSGDPIEFRLDIRADGGRCLQVHRRLLASPWGRLTGEEEGEVELANRPLELVTHVSRSLYTQVYALTLADLVGLRGESWDAIQERLVAGMGSRDLRPARAVAAELEAEADALWRRDRRGRPLVRRLQEEIRELRDRRRSARERDAFARERAAAVAGLELELEEVRRERQRLRAREEELAGLVPIRRQLVRIAELRRQAGDLKELEDLPAAPVTRLADLEAEAEALRARLAALEGAAEAPRRRLQSWSEVPSPVLEREAEVEQAIELARRIRDDRERMREMALVTRKAVREAMEASRPLFAARLTAEEVEAVLAFNLEELRGRLAAVQRARGVRQAREEALALSLSEDQGGEEAPEGEGPRERSGPGIPVPWWSVLVGGLLLLILGIMGERPILLVGAAAAAAAAIVLSFAERASRRSFRQGKARLVDEARRGLSAARKAEDEALHQAREGLRSLPFLPEILMDPALETVDRLEVLQSRLHRFHERRGEVLQLRTRVTSGAARVRTLLEELGLGDLRGRDAPGQLRDLLVRAREARDGALGAQEALEGLEAARADVEAALLDADQRLKTLGDRLRKLGDGDVGRGVARAEARLRAMRSSEELLEDLRRAHPDLEHRMAQIREVEAAGEKWIQEGSPPEALKAQGEVLQARAEELSARIAELREEIRHLERGETVDAIDGEIQSRMQMVESAMRDRDRLALLARVVREAERRFREEHQPDVIRRASEHLDAITGGRYRRVLLGDEGEQVLYVRGGGASTPLRVDPPLSTGTREQIYLSLRLAIVDHLDEGRERLPVFLDEALVNWDRKRRGRGLDRLATLSEHRQFFLFTCHDEVARDLELRGGRVIPLEPDV